VQTVEARFVLQTRGPAHALEIVQRLERAGFAAERADG
jgi:hypothetical protein